MSDTKPHKDSSTSEAVTVHEARHDTEIDNPSNALGRENHMVEITNGEQKQAEPEQDRIMIKVEAKDVSSKEDQRHGSRDSNKHDGPPDVPIVDGQPESSALKSEVSLLQDRIRELESRFENSESRRRRSSSVTSRSSSASSSGSDVSIKTEDREAIYAHRTIPEVRDCNWEQFKNRFGPQEKDYAIECLITTANDINEIAHEQRKRHLAEQKDLSMNDENGLPKQKVRFDKAWNDIKQSNDTKKGTDKRYLQRIRINSFPVLKRLGNAAGETTWWGGSKVFFQPFRALIHFHDKMREELQTLEKKLGSSEDNHHVSDEGPQDSNEVAKVSFIEPMVPENTLKPTTEPDKTADGSLGGGDVGIERANTLLFDLIDDPEDLKERKLEELMNSEDALQDLKCYVKFVDERLTPLYHQFDGTQNSKIRFDDLWYLFRTGGHVYVPATAKHDTTQTNSNGSRQPSVDQKIWKLYAHYPPKFQWQIAPLKQSKGKLLLPKMVVYEDRASKVNCYRLDYDGEMYKPVPKEFLIAHYTGEKPIRDLEVYPLRFASEHEQIKKENQRLGRNFVQYLTERPLAYNGWTLITDPQGNSINNSEGEIIKYPEHIDSDVIVDFKEAFQTYPPWRPEFESRTIDTPSMILQDDDFVLTRWSDSKRTESLQRTTEIVVEDDDIDTVERNLNLETDPYLTNGSRNIASDEDLVLLPSRLFAYSLRERKFVHVDVRFLNPITAHSDGFKSLRIDEDHRKMIQSLVSFHFKKKDVEKRGGEIGTQDLIRGKGKGLVILLHGVPGVGKTATAEAVAQANKKPLFPITCGDLGFTPESVETSLNEIFRLAHLWDCVLLLDEADIFLTQRTKDDLKRNALVSVFLRILEYFNGILFLTTNRPGTLDEAVKSRVHMSLYYSALGETETEEIFRLNLARLKEIEEQRASTAGEEKLFIFDDEIIAFAKQHYRKHIGGPGRWNGRQIRNAFQIAASLAHYDGEANPGAQRQLGARHFQTVDEATTKYDEFRAGIFGKFEDELAHEREERWDGFQSTEDRSGSRKTGLYGDEKRYHNDPQGAGHRATGYGMPASHQPSSQFQTPSPMTGYNKIPPPQPQGPPPQIMSTMQYPPQTPPAQRAGLPLPYSAQQQQQQYPNPGAQQLPPLQQQGYATPQGHRQQQVGQEPISYGQANPVSSSDSRYGAPNQGYSEYAARGPSPLSEVQTQAPPSFAGRGPYDPMRDVFVPGP